MISGLIRTYSSNQTKVEAAPKPLHKPELEPAPKFQQKFSGDTPPPPPTARPIRSAPPSLLDSREPGAGKGTGMKPPSVKGILGKLPNFKSYLKLNNASPSAHLVLGTVSGWTAGYTLMKVGKPVCFMLGGSVIALQLARNAGVVATDWNKLKDKVEDTNKQYNIKKMYSESSPKVKASLTKFARSNNSFAAGFVGGFLIGLISM